MARKYGPDNKTPPPLANVTPSAAAYLLLPESDNASHSALHVATEVELAHNCQRRGLARANRRLATHARQFFCGSFVTSPAGVSAAAGAWPAGAATASAAG